MKLSETMNSGDWPVTFSIGCLSLEQAMPDVREMLKLADDLMYSVKRSGKNRIAFERWPGDTRGRWEGSGEQGADR